MGEACLQDAMAPLHSRLDEVLSAGLAHMRLAPTGMRAGERHADSDWADVSRALNAAREAAREREDREQELLRNLDSVDAADLAREVNKHVAQLTKRQKQGLDARLAKAAAEYEINALDEWEKLKPDDGVVYETPHVPLTEEELFLSFIMNSDRADQLHAEEEPLGS